MGCFRELRVWRQGLDIVEHVHELTVVLPRNGAGELKAQMKRAAISVPSNIAEGAGRGHDSDFRRFLAIALASCSELATQLEIAARLQLVDRECLAELCDLVDREGKMLRRLIQSLE